jgi:hypothetical protein
MASKKPTIIQNGANVVLAVIQNDITYIKQEVDDIKKLVENKYVTKDEFDPIKKVVYGMVGLILVAVVGAVLALVISR